jgi:hypothetical protein
MRDCSSRRFSSRVAALSFLAALAVACGSRGPLDVDVIEVPGNGNGNDAGGTPTTQADAGGGDDTQADASAPTDAASAVDAPHEAGLINCGTCVAQNCGSKIVTCLTDPTCSKELQCIATTCLAGADGGGGGGGGGLGNLGCFTNCAGGNVASLAGLLGIVQCITTSCGADCGGVLGGLGGIPGLGGGGFNEQRPMDPNAGRVLFSAYPEICGSL